MAGVFLLHTRIQSFNHNAIRRLRTRLALGVNQRFAIRQKHWVAVTVSHFDRLFDFARIDIPNSVEVNGTGGYKELAVWTPCDRTMSARSETLRGLVPKLRERLDRFARLEFP